MAAPIHIQPAKGRRISPIWNNAQKGRNPFRRAHAPAGRKRDSPFVFGPLTISALPIYPPPVILSPRTRSQIKIRAEEKLSVNGKHHDFSHAEPTARLAVYLAGQVSASAEVCWAAAMLRNVCIKGGDFPALRSANYAASLLGKLELPEAFVQGVASAILQSHKFPLPKNCSPEGRVVWEAVNIQNMGEEGFNSRLLPHGKKQMYMRYMSMPDGDGHPPNPKERQSIEKAAYLLAANTYILLVGQFRHPLLQPLVLRGRIFQ